MKKNKLKTKIVKREFTLSKYDYGEHHFDQRRDGRPSFAESFSELDRMVNAIYMNGAPLGSTIEVIMKVKNRKKAA